MSSIRVRIGQDGRIVVPAAVCRQAGMNACDHAAVRVEKGKIILMNEEAAIRRAQEICRVFAPRSGSSVNALIRERSLEVTNERTETPPTTRIFIKAPAYSPSRRRNSK